MYLHLSVYCTRLAQMHWLLSGGSLHRTPEQIGIRFRFLLLIITGTWQRSRCENLGFPQCPPEKTPRWRSSLAFFQCFWDLAGGGKGELIHRRRLEGAGSISEGITPPSLFSFFERETGKAKKLRGTTSQGSFSAKKIIIIIHFLKILS